MIEMENNDDFQELKNAAKMMCSYCRSDSCEWCQVTRILSNENEDNEEEYIPCSTYRDYGPSNPWDAPGMSVKDFI